jgi:hypothetical protein
MIFDRPKTIVYLIAGTILVVVLIFIAIILTTNATKISNTGEIRFEVDGNSTYSVMFTYVNDNGYHQSNENSLSGHFECSVNDASNANVSVICESGEVTVSTFVNGNLVNTQSGPHVVASANL